MSNRSIKKPFNRSSVEALSWMKGEPAWMTEIRLNAWDRYQAMASDSSVNTLELQQMDAFAEPPRQGVPSHEWPTDLQHTLDERGDEEGLIIQRDGVVLSRAITKDAAKRGVIFSDLDTALKTVPELVKRYFAQQIRIDDPLAALHTAFWNGGSFLYVPAHVKIHLPFHTCFWMTSPGTALFPHTLLLAGPGSLVYFVDEYLSSSWEHPSLSIASTECHIAEKAKAFYFNIQNWGKSIRHLSREVSQVAPSAHFASMAASLGGQTNSIAVRMETTENGMRRVQEAKAIPWNESQSQPNRQASEFVEPILSEIPSEPIREKLRHYIVGKVTGRRPPLTLQRAAEWYPEVR